MSRQTLRQRGSATSVTEASCCWSQRARRWDGRAWRESKPGRLRAAVAGLAVRVADKSVQRRRPCQGRSGQAQRRVGPEPAGGPHAQLATVVPALERAGGEREGVERCDRVAQVID